MAREASVRPPWRSGSVNGRKNSINKTSPQGFELYSSLKWGLPHKPAFVFPYILELGLKKRKNIITGDRSFSRQWLQEDRTLTILHLKCNYSKPLLKINPGKKLRLISWITLNYKEKKGKIFISIAKFLLGTVSLNTFSTNLSLKNDQSTIDVLQFFQKYKKNI